LPAKGADHVLHCMGPSSGTGRTSAVNATSDVEDVSSTRGWLSRNRHPKRTTSRISGRTVLTFSASKKASCFEQAV
jgi:hypothetical protein